MTLPHEGEWRGSATATDTIGQADLRSATRDWLISSTAVAPSVTMEEPVAMTPPFAVPAINVEPGSRMTFSGTASDDEGLKDVEVSLRNSSTGENLGNDGTWGTTVSAGNFRVSPVNIGGSTYNWTYTTPFNLTPGTYSFTVRATDDLGLTTSSTNQGRLTINAQYAGNLAPNTTMSFTAPTDESLVVNLAGTATDDTGVVRVTVSLQDRDTGRYLQANGTMAAAVAFRDATLTAPNTTSTAWSLPPITLPTGGDWRFSALAFDNVQQDPSAATATYRVYPNDGPPTLSDTLGQPVNGSTFSDGKIVVTGRAEDFPDANASIAAVQVAIVNSAGQYMSGTGTFTSTTASFRTAFLNSPGSVASNYSYTTPVIPSGTYSVIVRSVDVRDQVMDPPRTSTGIVVTQPSNVAPVASFTYSCDQNVCIFDGRSSTDESPTSLTYSWNFGTGQGTGTGPLPTKTYTAASPAGVPFAVTLTVRDEWTLTNTSAPQNVTIVEPTGNSAPVPTFVTSCTGLSCSISSQGTADPNTADSITYSWNWGDATALSAGNAPSHTYAAAGAYTITLTTTDNWGKFASTTRSVTLTEPAGNQAPTVTFTATCPSYTTCQMNSAGTVDPEGDTIRYSWNFGDASALVTTTNPARTYAAPGTYTIALTVTDAWGRFTTVTHDVTMTEPAGNTGPSATFTATCTVLVCAMNSAGTVDPEGHTIKGYSYNWGDGTAVSATTGTTLSHTYATAGTYTITLTATDSWNRAGLPVNRQVTMQEPTGNAGPSATFTVTCTTTNTTCTTNSTGTTDPENNTPFRFQYNWGDGTPDTTGTASGPAHVYNVPGSYTVTLTAFDAWGRGGAPVTRTATTAAEPAGNAGPAVTFPQPVCTARSCTVTSTGTTDADGIRGYSWNWGDATTPSTGAAPAAHLYATAGTFTITVTVTDNWGRTTNATRTVTVA